MDQLEEKLELKNIINLNFNYYFLKLRNFKK